MIQILEQTLEACDVVTIFFSAGIYWEITEQGSE